MRKANAGFTLIELMIVVAIIGILASLATSAYQTYAIRAQIAEGVNMAANAKTPVVDTYMTTGVAPADRVEAGLTANPADTGGNYVQEVDIVDGRIDITFGGPRAHAEINGRTLSMTPFETSTSSIAWQCGNAPPPGGSLMNGGASHQTPTVDNRYLPGACRN